MKTSVIENTPTPELQQDLELAEDKFVGEMAFVLAAIARQICQQETDCKIKNGGIIQK